MMDVLGTLAAENCGHEVDGVLDVLYKICEDHPMQVAPPHPAPPHWHRYSKHVTFATI